MHLLHRADRRLPSVPYAGLATNRDDAEAFGQRLLLAAVIQHVSALRSSPASPSDRSTPYGSALLCVLECYAFVPGLPLLVWCIRHSSDLHCCRGRRASPARSVQVTDEHRFWDGPYFYRFNELGAASALMRVEQIEAMALRERSSSLHSGASSFNSGHPRADSPVPLPKSYDFTAI